MSLSTAPSAGPLARVIDSGEEALRRAAELAGWFAADAAERDADRRLPRGELEALSASGLLGITVPREYGGADVPATITAEVFRRLAVADPNIAQLPHSHFVYVNVLRENGTPEQQRFFFSEVLAGKRFGNAQAERGTRTALDIQTRLTRAAPQPEGWLVLDGVKHYATGALFAHWITVLAKDEDDQLQVAYVPSAAPGVTVADNWNGMGQRVTASGSVRLDQVRVPPGHVVPHHRTFTRPQLHGAFAQLLHTAIDVGIARAALEDAAEFVRTRSRPWQDSGVERACDDPLTIQRFGELEVRVRAGEALLGSAARVLDEARRDLTDVSAGEASVAVGSAKAFADGVSVELGSALFEVCGTRSAAEETNLHRHWRNARTHTLHDPVRWKIQHIGRYALNGILPPRTGQL